MDCLDIGADNGVISFLLRQRGGNWFSADLSDVAVSSIRNLVQYHVYKIDGKSTPFQDDQFDKVIIIDFLEHISNDRAFLDELYRIMKPGAQLVINVPHNKKGLIPILRFILRQSDQKHGHLRPGYLFENLGAIMKDKFSIIEHKYYSGFFSEFMDLLLTSFYGLLGEDTKIAGDNQTSKGTLITSSEMNKYEKLFFIYSLIYPFVWITSKLDRLLFFLRGYKLIVRAQINKKNAA